ncbi:MAG: enoyl-CoA hydratase [Pseudomonadota bacterium]|jgi:enoyl-CoA hydratase|nr:enoyl-CoA hydratase [Pseudomonadota bacterium]
MTEPVLIVDRPFDGCAVLTLNRPQVMNALSSELRGLLAETVAGLEADPSVRVLVLTGAGRAFCAGLDLKELGSGNAVSSVGTRDPKVDPVAAIGAFTGPVIVAVNGPAITGGFELALAGDVLVASSAARFADTHARVGVMPAWGLSQKLSRIIGISRAKELSLTGNFLDAQRAEQWGLVNRVVEPDALMPAALGLARDMLSTIPDMLLRMKRVIDEGYAMPFGEALAHELHTASEYRATIRPEDIESRRRAVIERGKEQRR